MNSLPGHEHLSEEVDWERNENEKKKKKKIRYRKAKISLKLFVNELLIKKEYFAILKWLGNLGKFREAAEVVLPPEMDSALILAFTEPTVLSSSAGCKHANIVLI